MKIYLFRELLFEMLKLEFLGKEKGSSTAAFKC